MEGGALEIGLCPGELAVCRLPAGAPAPAWVAGPFTCITRAAGELSIVCDAAAVPPEVTHQAPYRALRIAGPLDFGLTGVLACVAVPLAGARVPIFAIATYDTDYVLVHARDLATACTALRHAGHRLTGLASPAG
jgi:uncharacterized protein